MLLYSSYLGGGVDSAAGIAVDAQGNAYVAGTSPGLTDIPTVAPIMNQGLAFIFKLNPTGSTLIYSTHFGSSDSNFTGEYATGIAVTAGGEAYVTGAASAADFPLVNPITACTNNSSLPFVSKFNAAGSALVFSTCLSGPDNSVARGIAVDSSGNAYVTGQFASERDPNIDAFVQKLSATGAPIYSKRLGGSQNDMAFSIAADNAGNAYVTGNTRSTDFPILNAFQPSLSPPGNDGQAGDAFVTKLSPTGTILYSTLFGGTGSDLGYGIAVDKTGDAFVAGYTTSTDLPANAMQSKAGGSSDAFVVEFNPSGSTVVFSSYLGGTDADYAKGITLDGAGNIYVTGTTSSTNFPTVRPLQAINAGAGNDPRAIGGDAFITKIQAVSATSLPVLTSVSPNTTVAGSSFLATVSGQNLDSPSSVIFSGSAVSATVEPGSTSTSLILSINTTGAAIGNYLLSVSTLSGIATLPTALTVQAAPVPASPPLPIPAVETGPIRSGYAIITLAPGSPAPLTTLTYGMVGAGLVQSQAAILPTALTGQTTLPVNIVQSAGRNLGVALANPNNSAAAVTLQLWDQNGTAIGSPASISLLAGQQLARFLSELYPASTLGGAFQGSLTVQSAAPVSIIGLSFSGIEFSTVPILPGIPASVPLLANGTVGGTNAIMFPQFAMGGGWATGLSLVNATSVTLTGRIDIFDTSGKPMSVLMNGTTQSTFTYSIAPNGMFLLAPRDSNGQSPF
jgi:hypothetical protein